MLLLFLYNFKYSEHVFGRCCLSSAKNPSPKSAANLATATAKTQSVIEGLQARLTGDIQIARPEDIPQDHETEEDLERQLQAYFASGGVRSRAYVQPRTGPMVANLSRTQMLDELRSRVVEGVVHRILAEWARREQELPGSAAMGNEIMERLIQHVFEQFKELALAS